MVKTISALEVMLLKMQACLSRASIQKGVDVCVLVVCSYKQTSTDAEAPRHSILLVLWDCGGMPICGQAWLNSSPWGLPGTCSQMVVAAGVSPGCESRHQRWCMHGHHLGDWLGLWVGASGFSQLED